MASFLKGLHEPQGLLATASHGTPPQAQAVSWPRQARQSPCPAKTCVQRVLCSQAQMHMHGSRGAREPWGSQELWGREEGRLLEPLPSPSLALTLPRLAGTLCPGPAGSCSPDNSLLTQDQRGQKGEAGLLGTSTHLGANVPSPMRLLLLPGLQEACIQGAGSGARGPCGSCLPAPPLTEGLGANTGAALTPLPVLTEPYLPWPQGQEDSAEPVSSVHPSLHPPAPGGGTL